MYKKENIKIFCRCLATIVLLACALGCISGILGRKDSRDCFQEFYEQKENFDVLLLGTSHVLDGVSPMDMWEQNGIVAYNLSAPGCRIATSYWVLKNALQYTEPQLVVLDCAYLLVDKAHENTGYMHRILDSMPLSITKIRAIIDLYDNAEDMLRFLFPLSVYHSRWNELTKSDLFYKPVYGKMGLNAGCWAVNAELPDFTVTEIKPVDNPSTEYLIKIIELCKQQGLELLLTYIPFNASEESKNDAAYVRVIAEQYGINYLGPDELKEPINQATDFMDSSEDNSHLNLSGVHKTSYYLSEYISRNYQIADQRNNPEYSDWHGYYELYEAHKLSLLKEQSYLESYLVAMADKNYICAVYLNDKACLQNELTVNLLGNLGMDGYENSENKTCLLVQKTNQTGLDEAKIHIGEAGKPALILNDEVLYCWDTSVESAGVFAVVMDSNGENVLDAAAFSSQTRRKVS